MWARLHGSGCRARLAARAGGGTACRGCRKCCRRPGCPHAQGCIITARTRRSEASKSMRSCYGRFLFLQPERRGGPAPRLPRGTAGRPKTPVRHGADLAASSGGKTCGCHMPRWRGARGACSPARLVREALREPQPGRQLCRALCARPCTFGPASCSRLSERWAKRRRKRLRPWSPVCTCTFYCIAGSFVSG